MIGAMAAMGQGLQAALLLARGRPEGLGKLSEPGSDAMRMAARSFWAILLCLPAFICLHLIDWAQGAEADPARSLALDLMGYATGWLAFAVLSHRLAHALGRGAHWPRFIAAWNWCNVLQYLMLVAAALLTLLGLPDWMAETAWLVAMGWALWLEWFATRLTLALPKRTAAVLVMIDVAIGLFLVGLTGVLQGG